VHKNSVFYEAFQHFFESHVNSVGRLRSKKCVGMEILLFLCSFGLGVIDTMTSLSYLLTTQRIGCCETYVMGMVIDVSQMFYPLCYII
jgi:hypothetical protein